MKIILMKPLYTSREAEFCDIGLGYLASGLMRGGHDVKLFLRFRSEDEFRAVLAAEKPDMVGIKVLTVNVGAVAKTIKIVRENSKAVIVIGGPHVSGDPSGVLEYVPADYAMSSEADLAFVELARLLSAGALTDGRKSLPGLIYREAGVIRANPPEVINDLDALPFPAWELMPPGSLPSLVFKRFPAAGIIATRGCSNRCSFCAESCKKLRFRGVESVIAEIKYLVSRFNVREIQFLDSNFTAKKEYIVALCRAILDSGLSLAFCAPNGGRLEHIDEEVCGLLERIGFYRINIGIESGDPAILRAVRKDLDLSLVDEKVRLLRRHGIQTVGNFMLGFPGETRLQMRKTLDLALSLDLTAANFSIYAPMPGTKLYDDLVSGEKIPRGRDFQNYNFVSYENSLSEMSPGELRKFRNYCVTAFILRWRTLKTIAELIKSGIAWNSLVQRIYWMYISKLIR
ncbi:MAG: hypothetical protein A2X28_11285 [Elusimicrobia bacterium GWA2_56_46]|nr:MAG: hypothetical protein A2X28_11285 [Elusimicrobia bacterium GWA2_56_46]OGR54520.1 MAG: hypothetical protein A2X39_10070 [Elusimicrobia bacterium GWC2_56_31]